MRQRRGNGQAQGEPQNHGEEAVKLAVSALRREIERLQLLVAPPLRRPKLLVLDVNGLLVHRVFLPAGDRTGAIQRLSPHFTYKEFAVYERPHVRDFLRYCMEHFTVGIWSTANRDNITPMLEKLLDQAMLLRLAFVWDCKKCTYNGEADPNKPGKPIAFKVLSKLWEMQELAGLYGPDNTLLIDDSEYKARMNVPHTAIHPPAWEDPEAQATDTMLGPEGKLRLYLSALRSAETIPAFVEANPFATFACPPVPLPTPLPPPSSAPAEQTACAPPDAKGEEEEEEDLFEEDEIVLQAAVR